MEKFKKYKNNIEFRQNGPHETEPRKTARREPEWIARLVILAGILGIVLAAIAILN